MPNIHQYDSPINDLQPNNLGASALEQAARINRVDANEAGTAVGSGIGSLGKPIQEDYDTFVTQPEISKLSSQAAIGLAGLTNDYNKLATAPNADYTKLGQTFFDQNLNPFLESLDDTATTKAGHDFVQSMGDQFRQHFGEKIAGDQSALAGASAANNMQTAVNGFVMATSFDPTSDTIAHAGLSSVVDATLKTLDLTADQAATMRSEWLQTGDAAIAAAKLESMARSNPAQFQTDLDAGQFDKDLASMKPDAQEAIRAYAGSQLKSQTEAQKAATAQQDKQDKQDLNTSSLKLLGSGQQPDGSVQYGPDALNAIYGPTGLASMPGAAKDPATVRATYNAMVTANKAAADGKPVITDPATRDDFLARGALPPDDPRALSTLQVAQAVASGHLSAKDAQPFYKMVGNSDPDDRQQQNQFNTWLLNVAKPLVVPAANSINASIPAWASSQRWSQMSQDLQRVYDQKRKSGVSASDLLSPTSKDYILNNFPINSYQFSLGDAANMITTQPTQLPPVTTGGLSGNAGLGAFFQNSPFGAAPGDKFVTQDAGGATAAPARKPGESAADYLARTK